MDVTFNEVEPFFPFSNSHLRGEKKMQEGEGLWQLLQLSPWLITIRVVQTIQHPWKSNQPNQVIQSKPNLCQISLRIKSNSATCHQEDQQQISASSMLISSTSRSAPKRENYLKCKNKNAFGSINQQKKCYLNKSLTWTQRNQNLASRKRIYCFRIR